MTADSKPTNTPELGCSCKPWQQSWKSDTPGVCATCKRPFVPYSRAREVCLETEGCLLLPGHEGRCKSGIYSPRGDWPR